jgi:hypothetical protein
LLIDIFSYVNVIRNIVVIISAIVLNS